MGTRILHAPYQHAVLGAEADTSRLRAADQVELYACPQCGFAELVLLGRIYRPR